MDSSALDVVANGLTHRVIEWTSPGERPPRRPLCSSTASWTPARPGTSSAPALARAGFRVLAPDLRGFGEGARVPPGGYYHFPDYVLDVAELVDALVPAAAPLAGRGPLDGRHRRRRSTRARSPPACTRLVVVEGVGPPDSQHEHAPDRMRHWIEGVRRVRARASGPWLRATRRSIGSRTTTRACRATSCAPASPRSRASCADGRVAWKADPLHATRSPAPFFAETLQGVRPAHRVPRRSSCRAARSAGTRRTRRSASPASAPCRARD